jgi:hypothetical protein
MLMKLYSTNLHKTTLKSVEYVDLPLLGVKHCILASNFIQQRGYNARNKTQ